MPLLIALDECNCALNRIATYAQLGIEHPELRTVALTLIASQCVEVDTIIGELPPIIPHAPSINHLNQPAL